MTQAKTQFLKKTLTDEWIYSLTFPTEGRLEMRDTHLPALILLAGPKVRAWYVRTTHRGKPIRQRIGPWPVVSTTEARAAAVLILKALFHPPTNTTEAPSRPTFFPSEIKPQVRPTSSGDERTLSLIIESYIKSRKLAKKSETAIRSLFNRHAPEWLQKSITEITPETLVQKYRGIERNSLSTANKFLVVVGSLDRFSGAAYQIGNGDLVPRTKILLGGVEAVRPREVVIPTGKLKDFYQALKNEPEHVKRYLLALILSGSRANEIRNLASSAWDPVKRGAEVSVTKNGKPLYIYPGKRLEYILEQERKQRQEVLFNVPVKVYTESLERLSKVIELDFHLHDLRRTFATEATAAGVPEVVLKKLMNHSLEGNVTQKHYIKTGPDELRKASQKIEDHFFKIFMG